MSGEIKTTFMVDGREVYPTITQRLGILLIDIGGRLLKGSRPNKIEWFTDRPGDE